MSEKVCALVQAGHVWCMEWLAGLMCCLMAAQHSAGCQLLQANLPLTGTLPCLTPHIFSAYTLEAHVQLHRAMTDMQRWLSTAPGQPTLHRCIALSHSLLCNMNHMCSNTER